MKIPFCFPVFYLGLIAKRVLYSQPDTLNLLFNGKTSVAEEWEIDRQAANKYINGTEAIPLIRKESVFHTTEEELSERVRKLGIDDIRTTACAFHAFLRERVAISKEKLEKLEGAARKNGDPCDYVAASLRESLSFPGVTKDYISSDLKVELQNLHRSGRATDLFWIPVRNGLQERNGGSSLPQKAETVIPALIRGVMATLFTGGDTRPEILKKIQTDQFSAAAQEMLREGKMSPYDFYKWKNILEIAGKATAQIAHNTSGCTAQVLDFDWFLRFFDAAGNINSDNMQQLWARVLAGEIVHPGSFTLRAVETLRNMTSKEALIFKNAASLVLCETDGSQFLFCDSSLSDPSINERHGLGMADILTLEEVGLISALRVDNEMEIDDTGAVGFFNRSDRILLFESTADKPYRFHYKSYPLSHFAVQLIPIVQEQADDGYLEDLGKVLKRDLQKSVTVSLRRVLSRNGNDIDLEDGV